MNEYVSRHFVATMFRRWCFAATPSPLQCFVPNRSLNSDQKSGLDKYASFQPTPVSLQHFLQFGKTASINNSFSFLRRELLVRLAGMIREMDDMPIELRETEAASIVRKQYEESFGNLLDFVDLDDDPDVLSNFTETLIKISRRHEDTVPTMAEGVLMVKVKYLADVKLGTSKLEWAIKYFLDRLYLFRISVRMLINQHTLLFSDDKLESTGNKKKKQQIGAIDPECNVKEIVMQAYEDARFLSERVYMVAPDISVKTIDRTPVVAPSSSSNGVPIQYINLVYVPSHLYHIVFELIKNAIRATVEFHGEDSISFPPIKVLIVKNKEDLSIKISDRGGGFPRRKKELFFQYSYTTAPQPVLTASGRDCSMEVVSNTPSIAGYGYGLPLSRMYARYFAGDLELYSCDGFGTDAMVYLRALSIDAYELLPVYHEGGSRKVYGAQLVARQWTSTSPTPSGVWVDPASITSN